MVVISCLNSTDYVLHFVLPFYMYRQSQSTFFTWDRLLSVFQGPEKFWYLMLVAAVIIFQCITTDVYVFHKPAPPIPQSTIGPGTTTTG